MLEINDKLAEHTTQVAFHLTLTKSMISALRVIKYDQEMYRAGLYGACLNQTYIDKRSEMGVVLDRMHVVGWKSLGVRGLVVSSKLKGTEYWTKPGAELTEAGERVWDLLVMAGVVPEFQVPANLVKTKKSRKKSA